MHLNLDRFYIVVKDGFYLTWIHQDTSVGGDWDWDFAKGDHSGAKVHLFVSEEEANKAIDELPHKFAKNCQVVPCGAVPVVFMGKPLDTTDGQAR